MRPSTPGRLATYAVLGALTFVLLFPVLYAVSGSLMSARELSSYPPSLLPSKPSLEPFADVVRAIPLVREYVNSALVAAVCTIGQVITATLAAYAFVFLRVPAKPVFFAAFLATLFIPWEAVILPNYLFMAENHLVDTYAALVLPFLATGFGTFLLRQSFLAFPRDIHEAAMVDGCGHLRFLWSVLVPLSRPALASVAIWSFLSVWNQYFWPLLVTRSEQMQTLQIGISRLRDIESATAPNFILAGAVLAVIPTLAVIYAGQRHIVRGLTAGAIRG